MQGSLVCYQKKPCLQCKEALFVVQPYQRDGQMRVTPFGSSYFLISEA